MEGTWLIRAAAKRRGLDHRDRILIRVKGAPRPTDEVELVGRDLGFVRLWPESQYQQRTAHVGPDPLASDRDVPGRWHPTGRDEAITRLLARPDTVIGESLIDQSILAGVGNEYRNEIAFLLGANPWQPTRDVDPKQVVDLTARVMRANLHRQHRVFTGHDAAGQRHFVFLRQGEPCRRCHGPIKYSRIGGGDSSAHRQAGRDRAIWWCPQCQSGTPRL